MSTNVEISWRSASDQSYVLQATTNLQEWFAVEMATKIVVTPPINVYTTRLERASQTFYRVQLKP